MRAKLPARQPDNIAKSVGYQFYGKAGDRTGRSLADAQADRVAWVHGYGIAPNNPAGITAVLEAHHLAAMQDRTGRTPENPLLHFSISFDPKEADKATPEKQQEIAAQIIERMGLGGHIGFVVSHKDEPHPHMHFIFHRVHPETGKTWEEWAIPKEDEQSLRTGKGGRVGSKLRLHHHTRELAALHGFNVSREAGDATIAEAEYHDSRRQGRAPFRTFSPEQRAEIRGQTLGAFREATGWGDLSERLQAQGLRLGMAGQGHKAALYVYSETHKAKLSDVFGKEKDIRTGKLAERFGQRFTDYARENGIEPPERPEKAPVRQEATRAPRNTLDAPSDAYSTEYARRQAELNDAIREREAYQGQVSQQRAAEASAREAGQAAAALAAHIVGLDRLAEKNRAEIAAAIVDAYTDPAEARKAWERYEAEREHARQLAERAFKPERFGTLRGKARAFVKDAARRKALVAIERMKKARAQLAAARERAEAARLLVPAAEHKAKQAKQTWQDWTARTGDRQEQEARLAELNRKVREKAAALAELSRERGQGRDRDDESRGWDWND